MQRTKSLRTHCTLAGGGQVDYRVVPYRVVSHAIDEWRREVNRLTRK